jgi:hydrogenase nickel incorporation protein HypA/HybF
MHEVSIAQGILDIIIENSEKYGFKKVNSVLLRVGKASGIVIDALRFAFEVVKKDTIASEADLLIEEIPLGGVCLNCNNSFTTEDSYILECPHCGDISFKITQGRELDIIELDVEDI